VAGNAIAEDQPKNNTFDTTLKSVAIFRDGFGYYVREGKVKLENGWATTNFIPAAIRGTIWVYSLDKGDRIDTIVTTADNKIEFGSAKEIKGKLADKIGLTLSVMTNNGQAFEGVLSKTLDDMLLLQVGAAYNAVPYDQVRSISLKGFPLRVKIDTKDPNKVVTLGIAYLQEGISWSPSYVLEVQGSQAVLSLRASLRNTTEGLDKSDVMFVVGSPFVAFRGQQDLMTMINVIGGRSGGNNGQVLGTNIDYFNYDPTDNSIVVRGYPEDKAPKPGMTPGRNVADAEAGELFYYTKKGLSLATNDLAMVTIFSANLPVTPQFEWNADGDEVVYLLSIKNSGTQPLTTGSVFVLEDGKALGQEAIRYTPAGANAEIRLSRGIGMRIEKSEAEVKRGAPVKVGKTEMIPVTLKGVLTITNYRKDKAPLKIKKTVHGRIVDLSDDGKTKQTQLVTGDANPINEIEWKVDLAAGQTKVVTYTIETFIVTSRDDTKAPTTPENG
jgi:hypothetical protein